MCLAGPSGSGKTLGALLVATGLGGKIAVIDTERGSASLYSDAAEFDVLELTPPFSPDHYIEAIHAAEDAGYDVLVIDSITHEWNGSGGVLEIVDSLARSRFKGNSYAAWNEGTPKHRAFIDAMLQSNLHIIATMRTKAAYVEGERNGKKTIEKVGTAPEQRDGIEYEFTAVLDISLDNNIACATKDRTRLFSNPKRLGKEDGERLRAWLDSAADRVDENESKLADHLAAIEAAATLDELRMAFTDGSEWTKSVKDRLALDALILAKDKRKAILEAQAAAA
jgi:hypothetical protein